MQENIKESCNKIQISRQDEWNVVPQEVISVTNIYGFKEIYDNIV